MLETAYNLFLYVEGDALTGIGVAMHRLDGSDSEKIAYLQGCVDADFSGAARHPLPTQNIRAWLGLNSGAEITFDMFSYLSRTGKAMRVFEELLRDVGAPESPLMCVTPIVNGKPRIDMLTHIDPPSAQGAIVSSEFEATIYKTDFLAKYVIGGGLAIDSLLEDDFLAAIKLLHRHAHYVSAMKLLVSFIDTLAYLEYGDMQGNFVKWMTTYADIETVGVTPAELWEFRNALLHMTNPHSRKVLGGTHPALCFYINDKQRRAITDAVTGEKMFSFEALYESTIDGIYRWVKTYSGDLQKQLKFIDRYDEILSEGRIGSLTRMVRPERG